MKLRHIWAGAALCLAAGLAAAQDKVVYHVSDTAGQALGALRNIRNHLDTDPTAKITVVTHAQGVDYLMKGMKDKNGNPYETIVQDLVSQGVRFNVCEITLRNRKLRRDQFIEELKKRGISASVHYLPVHYHPYYRERYGFVTGDYPVVEAEFERLVSLPLFPLMQDSDVDRVAAAVESIVAAHRA